MPLVFEVVFVDKIVGNERRAIVEWVCLSVDPNLNDLVKHGKAKICKFLHCNPTDLIFCSLKVL